MSPSIIHPLPFQAILFDCDGVLVNSEPITLRVLTTMLHELGWELSFEDCVRHFLGKAVIDRADLIERETGQAFSQDWLADFRRRRDLALRTQVKAIEGIAEVLNLLSQRYGRQMAVASGADRGKVELMLSCAGLLQHFEGRIFSGHEMPRSKPAPDVYLAAAAALGADPRRCAVVEDTPTGVQAGIAAGAQVFGYAPHDPVRVAMQGDGSELTAQGAKIIFRQMSELSALLGAK